MSASQATVAGRIYVATAEHRVWRGLHKIYRCPIVGVDCNTNVSVKIRETKRRSSGLNPELC